ncbi:hypothetical protein RIVM261_068360 [Rivularia sp. IAM M-261]|nr:hypothetical protein CAL7716_040940 [Calothrix sp. PCC 7716]GJD21880.1 hypothetical protein RIVM261_068360 [Rivularia sp. IAM M-261]
MSAQIGFRINPDEKKAFEEMAKKQGKKPSEVLVSLVRMYIKQPIEEHEANEIEQIHLKIEQHEKRIAFLEKQTQRN